MKRFYSFIVSLMACLTMQAQYVVSDKYDLWFEDTGYEVTTRKPVLCTDNYQDLWNGCYVKTSGRTRSISIEVVVPSSTAMRLTCCTMVVTASDEEIPGIWQTKTATW